MIIYIDHDKKNEIINKNFSLFLDDERVPDDVTWIKLPKENWVIVRSFEEFIECVNKYNLPGKISLDHDLGKSSYQEFHRAWNFNKTINYSNIIEKTGYHACKWLIEYCLEKNVSFPEYYIHTMNPIGYDNIQSLIDSYNRVCNIET